MSISTVITIGETATRLGVQAWHVRRLFERGLLPPAQRVGAYRVVAVADLPKIETALRNAGYLSREREVANGN
jgi:DNA-binding transcriptional MerR regulator